jgi:sulfhydrogenase subunit alpha
MTRTIVVEHLARIEGHAGITVELDGASVKDVRFDIFEGIRLFEGLVRGRDVAEVPGIVSRICAICSHGHAITALRALERALGVEISPQAARLRELAFHGAAIESHALHVFCLALPDFLRKASVIEVAAADPDTVATALRLKKLGNTIQEVVGGRAVHPVNYVMGGFGKLPSMADLLRLRTDLETGLEDCSRVLGVLRNVEVPVFAEEPIRFAALVPDPGSYFFGETIRLHEGTLVPVEAYRSVTRERSVPHSTARHSMAERPYMVGALARLALNGEQIDGRALEARAALGPSAPLHNVVMNDIAQVIELVYSVEHALELVGGFLRDGLAAEAAAPFERRAGAAAAASEVPRGILFHQYEVDATGRIAAADVITPTAQNCAHVEEQFCAAIRRSDGIADEELRHRLEIIARAYDPCVSCSVHVIRTS